MPKAVKVLTSEKPCINKQFRAVHAQVLDFSYARLRVIHAINSKEASSLQLRLSINSLCKSYADSDIVQNIRAGGIFVKMLVYNDNN